jgi:Na+/H+ antiporter NhaD/arsenite permease-like protein
MITFKYLLLGLTYLGFGLGYLLGLRLNRAAIAIVGSAFAVALGMLDLKTAWQAIDPSTIVFLLGMMVVNSALGASGFFQLARRVFNSFHSFCLRHFSRRYFWQRNSVGIFLNDTTTILLAPLTLSYTRFLSLNPIPYLLALAGGTNLGSVATISGNPQTILVGAFSAISYVEFPRSLAPIALICLVVQVVWL